MSELEEYRRWCEYTQPLSLVERGKADAAIAEETARADRAEAALETANEHERQLIEVVAQHDRRAQDARNTAARRIRRARNETNAALDRAEQAEAALIYDSYGDMVQTWKSRAVALESARDSERTLRKQAEAENERLRKWQEAVFRVEPNIDIDIEGVEP